MLCAGDCDHGLPPSTGDNVFFSWQSTLSLSSPLSLNQCPLRVGNDWTVARILILLDHPQVIIPECLVPTLCWKNLNCREIPHPPAAIAHAQVVVQPDRLVPHSCWQDPNCHEDPHLPGPDLDIQLALVLINQPCMSHSARAIGGSDSTVMRILILWDQNTKPLRTPRTSCLSQAASPIVHAILIQLHCYSMRG